MFWYDNPQAVKVICETARERSPKYGRRSLRLIDGFGSGR